jgi:patatin-like phospholipase/acyl hydrolase
MTENFVPSLETGKFRVLALDGGGARGYLTARILANIEHYINFRLGQTLGGPV